MSATTEAFASIKPGDRYSYSDFPDTIYQRSEDGLTSVCVQDDGDPAYVGNTSEWEQEVAQFTFVIDVLGKPWTINKL